MTHSTDNATLTRLQANYPWAWALRIGSCDRATFYPLIETLKAMVPARSRKWNAYDKEWWFREEFGEPVYHLCVSRGLAVALPGDTPQIHDFEQAAAAMYLLPNAPSGLVRAVYRYLSKELHPDRGGSTAEMQRLNHCYELLTGGGA